MRAVQRYDGYRLQHPDFPSVQETTYEVGVVKSYDVENNTCNVNGENLPVFYHCGKSVELHENGGLVNGATAMWETGGTEDVEVTVLCVKGTPRYVIGFADCIPRQCCWEPFGAPEINFLHSWSVEPFQDDYRYSYEMQKRSEVGSKYELVLTSGPTDEGCCCTTNQPINTAGVSAVCTNLAYHNEYDDNGEPLQIMGDSTIIFEWDLLASRSVHYCTVSITAYTSERNRVIILCENSIPDNRPCGELSQGSIVYRQPCNERIEIELGLGHIPITGVELSAAQVSDLVCLCHDSQYHGCSWENYDSFFYPSSCLTASFKYICFKKKI